MSRRTYLTNMEEAVCVKYIELGSQIEAFRAAYDPGDMNERQVHKRSGEVFQRVHVKARIQELRDQVARESVVSRSWVVASLVKVHDTAMEAGTLNLAAANKALELMGIELGMFVRQQSTTVTVRNDPSQYTDAELEAIIRAGDRREGNAAAPTGPSEPGGVRQLH